MKIKVILVEDTPSLRKRFTELLSFYDDIELIDSYASGEAAINGIKLLPQSRIPDVILMDIELPKMNGIETTALVKENYPEIEIMMLTVFEDETKIFQAIQSGASGYMLKDESGDAIIDAIRELQNGGAPMSQSVARKVLSFLHPNQLPKAKIHEPEDFNLSERELELLTGIVQGDSYTTLAKKLFISPHTVKTHFKNIYKKLHVHSKATAVRVAIDRKLV
ncbi:MAG: response regulator transcription factor [Ignavibacteriales bacterium]|nr:response regulator transcription factor [Ignavibacteriales bacterium]